MNESTEIIMDPNHQMLRLYCGQCGSPVDIILEIQNRKISVSIIDTTDCNHYEDGSENYLKPIEIIV